MSYRPQSRQSIKGTYRSVVIQLKTASARVKRRDLGNVVVLSLTFLFLELERDAANRAPLDALHEMCRETGDLVPETLRGDDGLAVRNKIGLKGMGGKQGILTTSSIIRLLV